MYRHFTDLGLPVGYAGWVENVDLDFWWAMQGGSKMLSIQVDSIESTRIVSPVVDSSYRKSICETQLGAN